MRGSASPSLLPATLDAVGPVFRFSLARRLRGLVVCVLQRQAAVSSVSCDECCLLRLSVFYGALD